jgi:hypothetical protein
MTDWYPLPLDHLSNTIQAGDVKLTTDPPGRLAVDAHAASATA